MKKPILFGFIFTLLILTSCKDTSETDPDRLLNLKGKVYFLSETQVFPLEGALITVQDHFTQTVSDNAGNFTLNFEPEGEEDEFDITLQVSKIGYELNGVYVQAKRGMQTTVPDVLMKTAGNDSLPIDDPDEEISGEPAHIEIYGKHNSHVYVKTSGLQETAMIQFRVTDAAGVPVDTDHKALVHFEILNGPGGGEYLFPDTMTTVRGLAYTVLNSGTIAGPVQINAWLESDTDIVHSLPVRVAVYGGLPDQDHLSLGFEYVNIAGHVHLGIIDEITAFVGDRYSNPVAPGTIVYFNSDYGIIEGAAVTDEMGRATVEYMSAFPLPPQPQIVSLAKITAHTYGDTLQSDLLSISRNLLLTGQTGPIVISPDHFNFDYTNTPLQFNYTISDIWGYPLVSGSRISVEATDGAVYGDVNITTRDTQFSGAGTTDFSFAWAPGDSLETPQVYISIKVETPVSGNGYRSVSILGDNDEN